MGALLTMDQQYTIKEVAEIFKVNERTIRRWIKRGMLDTLKLPGRGPSFTEYRITQSAINELVERLKDD